MDGYLRITPCWCRYLYQDVRTKARSAKLCHDELVMLTQIT